VGAGDVQNRSRVFLDGMPEMMAKMEGEVKE
jgi:hypothetical protein